MWDHPACEECLLKDRCLFRDNNEVEDCGDVQDYEMEKAETEAE